MEDLDQHWHISWPWGLWHWRNSIDRHLLVWILWLELSSYQRDRQPYRLQQQRLNRRRSIHQNTSIHRFLVDWTIIRWSCFFGRGRLWFRRGQVLWCWVSYSRLLPWWSWLVLGEFFGVLQIRRRDIRWLWLVGYFMRPYQSTQIRSCGNRMAYPQLSWRIQQLQWGWIWLFIHRRVGEWQHWIQHFWPIPSIVSRCFFGYHVLANTNRPRIQQRTWFHPSQEEWQNVQQLNQHPIK